MDLEKNILEEHITRVQRTELSAFAYKTTFGELIYAHRIGKPITSHDLQAVVDKAKEHQADAFYELSENQYQLLVKTPELM